MMSVYRPAVEKLNAEELAELRLSLESTCFTVPTKVEITGVQISGDTATVFHEAGNADKGQGGHTTCDARAHKR
jgi:hypothetical protein